MRASELTSNIPGITADHLHNWERQGYLSPSRIEVGKKKIRDYSEKDFSLIKAMWFYYQKGLSPRNAHRKAKKEMSKRPLSASLFFREHQRGQERQVSEIDSLEGIAIFELAIPLKHYFHLQKS